MRCARCHRVLLHPAVTAGRLAWGRHCAKLAGVLQPKRGKRAAQEQERCALTLELFEGWDD